MEIELNADPEFIPAIATGFQLVAAAMFLELARTRGDGPWVDDLHNRLRYQAATLEPPEGVLEEVAERWSEAAIMGVDHIFDYVRFKPKD